jgi:hypothetical protein
MLPEILPLSARKSSEFIEQAPCMIFKMLLEKKKADLPRCIKTKYGGKLLRIEPLSVMICQ